MNITQTQTTRGSEALLQNLQSRLSTIEGSRDVFAEVIARYAENEIPENSARTLCYLLSAYLSYHKANEITEIIKRLEALEAEHEGN